MRADGGPPARASGPSGWQGRRSWLTAEASFRDALARVRRDGTVLETFLPADVAPPDPAQRWDGKSLSEVLDPERAARWLAHVATALDTGSVVSDRLDWSDGDLSFSFQVWLIRSSADEVIAIAREVGREERARAEAQAARDFLERVTELLPDIVYVWDHAERRAVFENRSLTAALGYSEAEQREFGGFPLPRLLHPDDFSILPEILAGTMALADDETQRKEGRFRAADGSWRWLVAESRVFRRASDGTPRQVFGIMRDVTEQRRLEERLHQAAKLDALGLLAGNIAHDFNNVLTAIRGFADLLEPNVVGEGREDLNELRLAIERGSGLAARLLAFSRAERRRLEPLDLGDLVRRLAPMLHRLVGSAIRLEIALPDGPAVVRADPTQLEQAIVNLVLNARDAMQDGGSVRVEVAVEEREAGASFSEEPGRWVHFGVSDTGVGMPPEVREHVFEPFFTTKDSGRGTGLGLTSALRAIEDAGGELHVESKPGEGTTFRARLPWCASPLAQDAGAGAGTGSAAAAGDILVVDDEPMVLRLVEATLVRAGHRVRAVADPQAALALVADPELAIDALISDVVLPGIAGPELARRVRALRPDVPVLFISGFVDSARLSPGDLDGGRVLRKPFSPRQLVDAAAELLAARRGGRNRGDTP